METGDLTKWVFQSPNTQGPAQSQTALPSLNLDGQNKNTSQIEYETAFKNLISAINCKNNHLELCFVVNKKRIKKHYLLSLRLIFNLSAFTESRDDFGLPPHMQHTTI